MLLTAPLRVLLGTIGAKQSLVVTPLPADFVIEDNYYLVGTACDWKIPQAIAFTPLRQRPYGDPCSKLINIGVTAERCCRLVVEDNSGIDIRGRRLGFPVTALSMAPPPAVMRLWKAGLWALTLRQVYNQGGRSLSTFTINMEGPHLHNLQTPAVMYVPNQFRWNKHGILYSTDYENFQGYLPVSTPSTDSSS